MELVNKPKTNYTRFDFFAKLVQPEMVQSLKTYVAWQQAVRLALEKGENLPDLPVTQMPLSINLDLTTACNFACTHCIDFDVLNSGIKFQYLEESLLQLIAGGLRSVIIIGGGEPTVDPKFVPVVHLLKDHGVQVAVVTNGTRPEKLVEIAPRLEKGDWIRFSLDSGTNPTFVAMHKPRGKMTSSQMNEKVEISLEEICSWVPKIREANPEITVGFSYIITWAGAERIDQKVGGVAVIENISEIEQAAVLAARSGFTEISFKAYLSRQESGAEVMDAKAIKHLDDTLQRIAVEVDKAKRHESSAFSVVVSTNLRVLLDGSWRAYTKQPKQCHMIALRGVLSPLGYYNCPAHRGERKARISHMNAFTDAEQTRESLKATAAMVHGFDASVECAEVTCMYQPTNWAIEQLISGELDFEHLAKEFPDIGKNWFL